MSTRKALSAAVLLSWAALICLPTGALADRLPIKKAEQVIAGVWDPEVPDGGNEPNRAYQTKQSVAVDEAPTRTEPARRTWWYQSILRALRLLHRGGLVR